MEKVVKILEKLGTIVVDRRFIASVVSLVVLFLGVPESTAKNYVEAIGPIIALLGLLASWTVRPPSGLNYKSLVDNIEDFADLLNERYGS